MTEEEILAAKANGTWLVWTNILNFCRLAHVVSSHVGRDSSGNQWCDIECLGGSWHEVYIDQLHLATPNDMLKYGD